MYTWDLSQRQDQNLFNLALQVTVLNQSLHTFALVINQSSISQCPEKKSKLAGTNRDKWPN